MRYITVLMVFVIMLASLDMVAAEALPVYDLHVTIIPEKHSLEGSARITVPAGTMSYLQSGSIDIHGLVINGLEYKAEDNSINELEAGEGEKIIEIKFSASFGPADAREDIENVGVVDTNVIDPSGVMLLSGWYPAMKGFAIYNLTVEIPTEFEAISESDSSSINIDRDIKTVSFDFPHPTQDITLVAGKYIVKEDSVDGVSIKTFFFDDEDDLSSTYIERTREYIELYKSMLGSFPYKSFSIVENNYQTGYSFPSYTLLGSRVIRLPFIVDTSLGHEILHQWFGNYVYVDHEKGNWSEGLTTYLADHWYKQMKGKGSEYRKKILIDYSNYVSPNNEISLREFVSRKDFATRTIGYGKTAMVFHMLRKLLGDEAFFNGLNDLIDSKKYRKATWEDIKDSFAGSSGEDLETFFTQWLDRKGVPSLTIKDVSVMFRDGHYSLSFDIAQRGEAYTLRIPVAVETAEGIEEFNIEIDKDVVHFEKDLKLRPFKVILDRNYDLIRNLRKSEKPPVMSAFTGNKENVVILPGEEEAIFKEVSDFFAGEGYSVKNDREATNEDIKNNSILIMSSNNRIYRRLFADRPLPGGGLVIKAEKNPLNTKKSAIIMQAKNREELNSAFRKIFRYGNYSLLIFDNGRNTKKETAGSDSGIIKDLRIEPQAIETKSTIDLDTVINKIKDKRVIFVGEMHTSYSHHVMQYEIIRKLYDMEGRLVIGMEMFQQPFQEHLDKFIKGEIDEGEFLKKTEYFQRWKFDYNLYRDILHFARYNNIPVIALNLKKEIITKVSKEGIDSLSDEELAEIPRDIDMTNQSYRKSMKEVFSLHLSRGSKSFDNFFQSQILWDETMAHNTAEALESYPDSKMVVLAGNGHLQYSWGIPDRVKRLSGESIAIVLNNGGDIVNESLADFILYPPYIEVPKSPKLMVFLDEIGKQVKITKLIPGGASDKAGLREKDTVLAIDNDPVEDVADLKIILLNKSKGDVIKVKVQRPRFLFGPKELIIDVTL
ncbi:MAG: ChaN family lipoprotein [Thermodesulfovibrionales bacterium]